MISATFMKILVMGADRATADWIANLLNADSRYAALPLYSPADALEHAQHISFDVAVVGCSPGDPLGARLAQSLRTLVPRFHIVVMAKQVLIPDMRFLFKEFNYLSVPFESEGLLRKVVQIEALDELRAYLDKMCVERSSGPRRRKRALKPKP